MKKIINKILTASLTFTSLLMGVGCASYTSGPISIEPEALVLTPNANNDISVNSNLNIPPHYIASRNMVTIEPVLILGDQIEEKFEPITLYGKIYKKKMERLEKLYGYRTSIDRKAKVVEDENKWITLNFSENITIDNNFDSGKIEAYITRNGCGQCYGVDTIDIAYLSNLSSLIEPNFMFVHWIDTVPPPHSKTHSDRREARLQFELDKSEILPSLANNRAELDSMLKALTPVLTDPLSTLHSLKIFGSASAEGGYKHNVKLAQERANAAKNWIDSRLHMSPKQKKVVKIGSEPEGWGPVVASMHAAGDPDSIKVKRIIQKYPDVKSNAAEMAIRKLACWPNIAAHHLAKDRKVTFDYAWEIKSFDTPQEALLMYQSRPETLNEYEFLLAASILSNTDSIIALYETFENNIPTSEIAITNLASLYFNQGKYWEAISMLEKHDNLTPQETTTLAMCYTMLGDDAKAIDLLRGIEEANAIYNLGILQARNHNMAAAYDNLKGTQDLNTAIAALGINENEIAWEILQNIFDPSCKADYVRAIVNVRLGNHEEALKYLNRALSEPELKQRAKTEADFRPLYNEWKYNQLMNK